MKQSKVPEALECENAGSSWLRYLAREPCSSAAPLPRVLVQLLPVSLAKLWVLNDSLRKRSDAGDLRRCLSGGNVS